MAPLWKKEEPKPPRRWTLRRLMPYLVAAAVGLMLAVAGELWGKHRANARPAFEPPARDSRWSDLQSLPPDPASKPALPDR